MGDVFNFRPLGTPPVVAVEERAHGGWDVVIRIDGGPDREHAAELARAIREKQWVDLREHQ